MLDGTLLGTAYLIALAYVFLGIAIISDIFMEAIEVITAQTKTTEVWDPSGKTRYYIEVPIWNATVANLTLMALGSSAPEILLSVIGTVRDIEALPSKLGPSTIVGSAAFNLLVISGLSVVAVGEEPKKVADVGVFAVTSVASLFAYIWLYLTLKEFTPDAIETWEAWLTFIFFFLLIIFSYTADKINAFFEEKRKTLAEKEDMERQSELNIKKNHLRNIAKEKGEGLVLEIAQGINSKETQAVSEMKQREIRQLYKEILGVPNPAEVDIGELLRVLQPDSLLERFAYRKQAGMAGSNKEFIKLKGQKGQIDHSDDRGKIEVENEQIGFKCLHYSVTESNGTVEITIVKKANIELTFGYRTVADSARPVKDFTPMDDVITMKKREVEHTIYIPIIDDDEWEPDLDFFVELYDPNKLNADGVPERMMGDDTRCKVTILDEDFPGSLGFEMTDVRVHKGRNRVEVNILRMEGADGTISCMIRTEPLSDTQTPNTAVEFEDYVPLHQKVVFLHGENMKTVNIDLVNRKTDEIDGKLVGETDKQEEKSEDEDEACDVIFKVKLEAPEPAEVKISKKNVCLVTILKSESEDQENQDKLKLYEFYMMQKEPDWAQQFKNAVSLGPQIDEDNMILEEVSATEALFHFVSIGWKVLFALVPPPSYWGGKAAFVVALAFIGLVTGIVGSLAEVLGCVLGIEDSVTAITLVALGTSLPDTFASMTAARTSEYADAAIGNVTGSNSVNVFLGLGLPWVIAASYFDVNKPGEPYRVPAGDVAYSVFVFLVVALVCFVILIARRVVSHSYYSNLLVGHWRRAGRTKLQQMAQRSGIDLAVVSVHRALYHQRSIARRYSRVRIENNNMS